MTLTKRFAFLVFFVVLAGSVFAADDVTGLWQGVDEETGETTMMTYIYEYRGEVHGRMVVTFDEGVLKDLINEPNDRATLWQGDPYYAGMDIIWGMQDRGNKWKRGKICDPKEGKIYDCEIWLDGENLIVRGKIGPFGRSQTWLPVPDSALPAGFDLGNPNSWVPVIPVLK